MSALLLLACAGAWGCGGGPAPATQVSRFNPGDTLYVAGAREAGPLENGGGSWTAPGPPVPGFRVQVYQSLALADAESHARVAAVALGVPAYVEFRAPYYRVRVGDCRTRAAGEGLLGRVLRSGYPGAALVPALLPPEADPAGASPGTAPATSDDPIG